MIPEIGHFALILGLILAIFQSFLWIPAFAGMTEESFPNFSGITAEPLDKLCRPLSLGQFFFVTIAFICLTYAFLNNDFSVVYVYLHSNSTLPFWYQLSAVWAGHEGSFLLWEWILSFYMALFAIRSRQLPLNFVSKVLTVMGVLSTGFLLFILSTSNPFLRSLPDFPIEGNDLNPLLQDPGLIIHPPILYMGYVGMALPFAFAIAMLWNSPPFIKALKPWVFMAWSFLTLGIALGSWWAYYELGWGGWWFWDPVENASFMPWILGTALIHCLKLSEKRNAFYGWTLLICILCFSFSLLGTFLVRSNVISSVHAFANDPKRGVFLFQFFMIVCGGALLLYALKINKLFKFKAINDESNLKEPDFKDDSNLQVISKLNIISKESFMLTNVLLLLVAAGCILLGTLYPLIIEAVTNQKISVGSPYFNAIFIPLMIPVLFLMPIGTLCRYGKDSLKSLIKKCQWPFLISMGFLVILAALKYHFWVLIGLGFSLWIILGTLQSIWKKNIKNKLPMVLAHIGVAITVIGITIVSQFEIEREVKIKPKESIILANYQIYFDNITRNEGPNYIGYLGHFKVKDILRSEEKSKTEEKIISGTKFGTESETESGIVNLYPEKRIFVVQETAMTETAIDAGFFRDIYISLGEKLEDRAWTARIYYKPFVRWIWFGAILMALGGFLGTRSYKRYRSEGVRLKI